MNCHANVILFLKHIWIPSAHHFNALALHLSLPTWERRRGWKLLHAWCHSSRALESADVEARPRADSSTAHSGEKGVVASSSHCQLLNSKELLGSKVHANL